MKQDTLTGISSSDTPMPSLKRGAVGIGCVLGSVTEIIFFPVGRYPRRGPGRFSSLIIAT
jgi:hypothetical protein